MLGKYILIAGKEELFKFVDGHISRHETIGETNETVTRLRLDGYKIFIVSEVIDRIDDFINARSYEINERVIE